MDINHNQVVYIPKGEHDDPLELPQQQDLEGSTEIEHTLYSHTDSISPEMNSFQKLEYISPMGIHSQSKHKYRNVFGDLKLQYHDFSNGDALTFKDKYTASLQQELQNPYWCLHDPITTNNYQISSEIDIKTMPQAFGSYHLLLVITCDLTNFTIAVSLRNRQTQTVAEALIYTVIYLFGPPRQIVSDEAIEFTSAIVQAILMMLNCRLKDISTYNHGSSKCKRQTKTISEIIVKHLWDKGQMWPLFATTAAYAINTFASEALGGFSPFQLVF